MATPDITPKQKAVMAKKKTAATAARKKAAVDKRKKAATAKKKTAAKKNPTVRFDDPDKLKPIVYQRKFGATEADKKQVLTKMTVNVRQSMEVLNERSKKRPVKLLTPAMLRRALMPYEELYFQYMLNSIGFRTPLAIEIIAPEKVGATTFVMDWMSRLLDLGCYSVYCECEGKQMDDKRIKRLMDRDPKIATMKLNAIEWAEARQLVEFDNTLRQTVKDLRKRCDADPQTKGKPIFFFGDPWGALMSKSEAKGNSDWGLSATAKPADPKDTTDGSNFEHAKHAQGMARWLPAFMEKYNCTIVFVNKQNDKIDMNAMPSYMTPSPLKNDTRIGGKALKRLCAYRMTMLKLGDIREKGGEKRVYGHHLRAMLVANSYGPRDRTCEFTIFFDNHDDTPGYQAPGFTFDDRTAAWIASKKFLGTTVEKDLYTCDTLGCVAVPPSELMDALRASPDNVEYIGSQLGIEGYAHEVQDIAPIVEEEEGPEVVPGDDVIDVKEVPMTTAAAPLQIESAKADRS